MLSLKALRDYATALLAAAGCDEDKARTIARLLVAADAMGHTTHGLAQLPAYLAELERGGMLGTGEPSIVADRGAAVVWDGRRLPGVWLTERALAVERAASLGVCVVSIRRSHHIACLAAFLPYATERGMLAIIACSDPSVASVAPFGAREAVFTPDPIAVGIPTPGEPILIDTSASITTNGMAGRLRAEGRRFPGAWAIDAAGQPTDDPNAPTADPPGALLPAGGLDHGQKGYALALMIEALTQGLSGHGRADHETQWGASVFVQVFDPALFGGAEAFTRQTGYIADLCRAAAPIDPASPVRLPGQSALSRQREAEAHGIVLHPGILDALAPAAARYGVTMPQAASG